MKFPYKFGKYVLNNRLAVGGMAEIFSAVLKEKHGFEKQLVVKKIMPQYASDPHFSKMFIREAKIAASLQHSNIVQIFDFDAADDTFYMALEHIDGQDLRKIISKASSSGNLISETNALYIICELLRALDYIHTKKEKNLPLNIIHRDISPHNVIISYEGEVKLADFGIARAANESNLTRTGILKGKLSYMAPEQAARGTIDNRVDLFACSLILYELLSGHRMFTGESESELIAAVTRCEYIPINNFRQVSNPEIEKFLIKALDPSPQNRFKSAYEMEDNLCNIMVKYDKQGNARSIKKYLNLLFKDELQFSSLDNDRTVDYKNNETDNLKSFSPKNNNTLILEDEEEENNNIVNNNISNISNITSKNDMEEKIITNKSSYQINSAQVNNTNIQNTLTKSISESINLEAGPNDKTGTILDKNLLINSNLKLKKRSFNLPMKLAFTIVFVFVFAAIFLFIKNNFINNKEEIKITPKSLPVLNLKKTNNIDLNGIDKQDNFEKKIVTDHPTIKSITKEKAAIKTKINNSLISEKYGVISISSEPWTQMWIDGKKAGESPILNKKLSIGKHIITLKNKRLNIYRDVEVTIESGKTKTVREIIKDKSIKHVVR